MASARRNMTLPALPPMPRNKEIPMNASAVIWSAIRNWGQRIGTILTFLVLVRLLEPKEIGVFAAAAAVIALLDLFTDNGIGDAVVQSEGVSNAGATALVIINVSIAAALAGLLVIFTSDVTAFLKIEGAETILRIAALALILNAVSFVPQAMLRKEFLFKRLAYRSLASTVIGAVTGISMALGGFGVWAMLGQLVVVSAINMTLAWFPRVFALTRPDFVATKPFLRFGSRVFASRILYYAASRLMEILIPSFFGTTALGLYFMASRLPAVLAQMISAVAIDVSLPRFSKLAGNKVELQNAFFGSLAFSASLSTPAFFLLGTLAPEIQVVAFGPNGAGAETLLLPIAILCAVQAIGLYNEPLLNASGMPHVSMYLSFANTAVSTLTFFLMRNSDVVSFIYAYTLVQCISIPVLNYVGSAFMKLSFLRVIRIIAPLFGAASLGLAAVMFTRPYISAKLLPIFGHPVLDQFALSVVLGALFTLIYFGVLFAVDRQSAMILFRQLRRRKR
jgi:O-antigen/teichoic acid export membrane protein